MNNTIEDQFYCKVIIFAVCPIQKNIYMTIKSPNYEDCHLSLEKTEFYWGRDLEQLIYSHIDEFEIQKREQLKKLLEEEFLRLKETTPTIKITINPLKINEKDYIENKYINTLDEYMQNMGFLFGHSLTPIIRVIIPKNKEKRLSIEKIAPAQINPKAYADRWQRLDFEKHFTENFPTITIAARKFEQIGMAIYFYLHALTITQQNFRIINYKTCIELLENLKRHPKLVQREKEFLKKFNEEHKEELTKYRRMRNKLVHKGELIKKTKINGVEIPVNWSQDVIKFRELIEKLIIEFSKCSQSS